jgi:hypothetical protein
MNHVATPIFDGDRTFTWFTPRRRTATDYELYTVGQYSDPGALAPRRLADPLR